MNFAITQEIDVEAQAKSKDIIRMAESIRSWLKDKDYGKGIQNFIIGFICIKERPGYEHWFKVRRPKYKEIEKVKLLDGSTTELKGVYSYDIKLDFGQFIKCTESQSENLLASEILKSLSNLDALPKKVKDFDMNRFKTDMERFFLEQELLDLKEFR